VNVDEFGRAFGAPIPTVVLEIAHLAGRELRFGTTATYMGSLNQSDSAVSRIIYKML
jgi:hypothetical protein